MAENKTTQQETLEEMESHTPPSMHPILEAAFKYQKQIVIAVALILGVTAIYAGLNAYNKKAMNTAQANLGEILITATGQAKIDKLQDLLAIVPSDVKPAVQLEIAQASMQLGQFDKAAEAWGQLIGDTDNDMQIVARLGEAKALLLSGKAADATAKLKDLAGLAPEAFTVPVYRQLALAAEAAGDKTEALSAYEKLAENQVSDKPFIDYKISQLKD